MSFHDLQEITRLPGGAERPVVGAGGSGGRPVPAPYLQGDLRQATYALWASVSSSVK